MVEELENSGLERMWKGRSRVDLKYFPGGAKEKHENIAGMCSAILNS
jgi:hypothetical protein